MLRHFVRIAVALCACAHLAPREQATAQDSSFAAMQQRGKIAMGVDQYTSIHKFDDLSDGGRIELQRDRDDSAGVSAIRDHLRSVAKAFAAGDFSTPAFVHLKQVPGSSVLARKHSVVRYVVRDLPRGAELRIVTSDPAALRAAHDFLAFQRGEHRASGTDLHHGHIR